MNEKEHLVVIKTLQGLEDVLAQECRQLGFRDIEILNRAVRIRAGQKDVYRANYHLRTALKVLVPVNHFLAETEDALYEGVRQTDWGLFLDPSMTLAVEVVLHSRLFSHSKFLAQKTKDAIVDQIREHTNRRPRVDLESPDIRISLHIDENKVGVYLDSSGDPLYMRGYRVGQHQAPLNEVLAAGILMLAGWKGQGNLVDPMCGSGTLLIEGAMMAHGLPPGMYREAFGFEKWKDFDADLFDEVTEEEVSVKPFTHQIVGGDIQVKNILMAKETLKRASLIKKIELVHQPMEEFIPPAGGGFLVTNPPYGERIGSPKLIQLYSDLGTRLKHHYAGYEAWIFSGSVQGMKNVGLRPTRRYPLLNGSIPCSLSGFQLYKGSKKARKQPDQDAPR